MCLKPSGMVGFSTPPSFSQIFLSMLIQTSLANSWLETAGGATDRWNQYPISVLSLDW